MAQDAAFDLSVPSENNKAPESRVRDANQAFQIASELKRRDGARARKRVMVYKCYKRFPPTGYKKLKEMAYDWVSDVPFGMLEGIVDSSKSSFNDIVTDRNGFLDIKTRFGKNPTERKVYSEHISAGFDLAMEAAENYLLNQEQVIENMNLTGKGVEMWDNTINIMSEPVQSGDLLVPDKVKVNLSNADVIVRLHNYTAVELWEKIKDRSVAEKMGWNVPACVEAIRYHLGIEGKHKTLDDFYREAASGGCNILSYVNKTVDCYELFVREYDGKISILMCLQDYFPLGKGRSRSGFDNQNKIIDSVGFLRAKQSYFDDWKNIIQPFTDSAGSGLWHEIKGIGERAFPQAAQYDRNMNRAMDAIFIKLCFALQGDSAEADQVLSEIGLKPYMNIPHNVRAEQVKFDLPIQEVLQGTTYFMQDLFSNMAIYRPGARTHEGRQRTKGEAELDAAESAKLSGTQVRRFVQWQTVHGREIFRRLVHCKSGNPDYRMKEIFLEYMEENDVPEEAWEWDNIRSIKSNMLSGAGSPSFKMMAADRTIAYAGMTAISEGQEEAIKDGISAVQGRQNVQRFRPPRKPDINSDDRIIGFENAGMSQPGSLPENFMVQPADPHIKHIQGHFQDGVKSLQFIQSLVTPNTLDQAAVRLPTLDVKGGHIMAHVQLLSADPTKEAMMPTIQRNMNEFQGMVENVKAVVRKMAETKAKEGRGQSPEEMELEYKQAMAQLDIYKAKTLADIKIGTIAQAHAARAEQRADAAANEIAISRVKAEQELQKEARKMEIEARE